MPPSYLIKPSLETNFYIDYEWWKDSRDDLSAYLMTHLSPEQLDKMQDIDNSEIFDHVHPETGEVFQLDALGLAILESSKQDDFITTHIGLIDSIFRAFLVNDNRPLNPQDLSEITGRDAPTILKTIGGVRVYRGIRPYQPPDEGD